MTQQNRNRRPLGLAALLAGMVLAVGSAYAHPDEARAGDKHHDMRERMEEHCKAEPQKCEEIRKRIEDERAACKQDPKACDKKRDEWRAKLDDARKAHREKCDKDPEACKKERDALRDKLAERCKTDPKKCDDMKPRHGHDHDHPHPPPKEAPTAPPAR